MELKIKIKKAGYYSLITDEEVEVIEKIADDYAIEFAEWFIRSGVQFYDNKSIGNVYTYIGDLEVHTSKELLEIFKKEKGL
jgi:hypothetical protein